MALNEKNPPVITNLSLIGVDGALQKLAVLLSTIPWLEKSWGRAKMVSGAFLKKAISEPMVYLSDTEYYTVMPNDVFKSYSFWAVNGPEVAKDSMNIIQGESDFEVNVSCVVWVNLKRIDPLKDFLYCQELVRDVLIQLNKSSAFTLGAVIDERVEDIFRGYSLTPAHRDLLMFPYQAFRIEGKLNYTLKLC